MTQTLRNYLRASGQPMPVRILRRLGVACMTATWICAPSAAATHGSLSSHLISGGVLVGLASIACFRFANAMSDRGAGQHLQ